MKKNSLNSNVSDSKGRKLFVAAVIERNGNGDTFASILNSYTTEGIFDEVLKYLLTEENERNIDLNFDEDALKHDLSVGNEDDGPFSIECENWDTEFLVAAKVINV